MSAVAETLTAPMSAQDYLAFLQTRPDEERWQLIDGEATMMTPPTLVHQRIALNFVQRLNAALETTRPELVAMFELGVTVPDHERFLPVADVVVVEDGVSYDHYSDRFYLAAEILSESNTREYISLKVERYRESPDNLYTLVIAQHEHLVEIWSRADGWKGRVLRSPDDGIELAEFGFRCSVRDLYRGTPLK